jgi:tetratricopeptide (TPR) repeat protein
MEAPPTRDLAAYDLYLQAKDSVNNYLNLQDQRASLLQAVRLLDEAVARDSQFALAYCYAARAHSLLYFLDHDPTADRRTRADQAVTQAMRLQPDSAEVHLAQADFQFRCRRDYQAASRELTIARPLLPNSSPLLVLSAYLDRRLGRWKEGEEDFNNAVNLDPRNANAINLLSDTFVLLRKFREGMAVYERAKARGFFPDIFKVRQAAIAFAETGNIEPLEAALDASPQTDVGGGETALRILFATIRRDAAAARARLAASPRSDFQEVDFTFAYPRAWYEAIIARQEGDSAKMREAFVRTREILATRLAGKPEDARTLAVLAQVDAGLGQKEDALREARHAVELMPLSRDAYDAPLVKQGLAQVYTWTGETDAAVDVLQELILVPGYLTYGYLRVDPAWQPLRGHPRFDALVASLAPR